MTTSARPAAWSVRDLQRPAPAFAVLAVIAALGLLQGVVRYCPGYGVGRGTLLNLFATTFWGEFFSGRTTNETLAGEATASQWSHCLLVPFIFALLLYWRWPQLRAVPVRGHAAGYGILALGALLYLAGYLMENTYVGIGAMEVIYAGLVVLLLGWPMLGRLAFPIAFLMFMYPYDFMEDIALQLRLLMSQLGHGLLQALGAPNELHGTAIMSPPGAAHPFAIDIADPCSGIRSLFALVMIACVIAYLGLGRFWKQLLLVALSIPAVILGNLVRIVLLALATIHFGDAFAIGTNDHPSWFHEGAGYLVYLINFGGLLAAAWALERFFPDPAARNPAGGAA